MGCGDVKWCEMDSIVSLRATERTRWLRPYSKEGSFEESSFSFASAKDSCFKDGTDLVLVTLRERSLSFELEHIFDHSFEFKLA